jgi:SAM-dependent methyltransferase
MPPPDDFLRPSPAATKIDRFLARRSILRALQAALPRLEGTLLDIGCGQMPYKPLLLAPPSRVSRYLGLDSRQDFGESYFARYGPPDLEWDGRAIPLPAGAVDCALATEVLIQVPRPGAFLQEAARVLKPGGLFFFTVPFLWPVHDAPYDQWRFTPFALRRLLEESGFTDVALSSLGGWDASLAQMIALWVRRRPMGPRRRWLLSQAAAPLVRLLAARDRPAPVYADQTMPTALAGTARKPRGAA